MSEERKLVRLTKVEAQPVEWVWQNRIAIGAITVLDGDPSQGKSRICYDLAARLTRGQPMPGESSGRPRAGVVLVQGEDDPARTVRPILTALHADFNRVVIYDPAKFVTSPLTLPDDLDVLRDAVGDVGAKLVVIDPTSTFFSGSPNSDQTVRKALGPLADLAREKQAAVLLVRHLRKGRGPVLSQGAGSMAWIAAARTGLRAISDLTTDNPHRHLLVQVKTNLASAATLAYQTVLTAGQAVPEWLGEVPMSARDLDGGGLEFEQGKLQEAAEVLYLILQGGPLPVYSVLQKARGEGQSQRTLERAKKLLSVRSYKNQFSPSGAWNWNWRLPDNPNPALAALMAKYEAAAEPPVTTAVGAINPSILG